MIGVTKGKGFKGMNNALWSNFSLNIKPECLFLAY